MKNYALLLLTSLGWVCSALAADPVMVGILEPSRFESDQTPGLAYVRYGFVKKGTSWVVSKEVPKEKRMKVAYDGRNYGEITLSTRVPDDAGDLNSSRRVLQLASKKLAGKERTGNEFGGWSGMKGRPYVVVSMENFKDPDGWKLTQLTTDEKATALARYLKDLKGLRNCKNADENKGFPMIAKAEDVQSLKSYRAKDGRLIYGFQLNSSLYQCDGIPDGEWLSYWYFVGNAGKAEAKLLGRSLVPVDAGDYDVDGKSEFVFFSEEYNLDGYRMFWGDFTRSVKLEWSYH